MSASIQRLEELRAKLGEMLGTSTREYFQAPGVAAGIPRGAIVELAGTQKTEWLLRTLQANPSFKAFWIEREQTVLPTAIHQRGVGLERITFAIAEEFYPALRRAIQSQLFEVVIAPSTFDELRVLKGLQLISEKANSTLFLISKQIKPAWPISVQLEVNQDFRTGELDVSIVKHKQAGIS